MKKRLLCLTLAIALLAVPARAAENSMDNFLRREGAYTGQFSDLTAEDPFYENVSALYEYGLSVGKGDGTFGLKDPLTVSQAVIFAGRIRGLYRTGNAETATAAHPRREGQPVCGPYLDYLKAEGVLGEELDGSLFTAATRAQMAHVLANVLPEEAMPPINRDAVTEGYAARTLLPDVTEYTPWQQDILKLYRCGIARGSDAAGTFHPDAPITRGAAAAMLTRLAEPALRIRLEVPRYPVPEISVRTLGALVEPGTYFPSPATEAELDSSLRHMLSTGSATLRLTLPDLTVSRSRQIMTHALELMKELCEQGYNAVEATTSGTELVLRFSATAKDLPANYRQLTLADAIAVHDRLWQEGAITPEMTELEKARVYYNWICLNCAYDDGAGDDSPSHLPYSLFRRQLAVCDGYTGAYNLLLKLEGIDCRAIFTDDHIWTAATLDGTRYHIDTTWGDKGETASPTFFAMTPALSEQLHRQGP